MSAPATTTPTLDQDEAIRRNLEIASAFTMAVARNEELLAQIPDDVTIVFMPDDDPELCAYNRALAIQRIDEGRDVWVRRVKPGEFPPLPHLDHNPFDDEA